MSLLFTVAVDFDGTIAPSTFPEMPPAPFEGARGRLQQYRDYGYRIIVFTCRTSPRFVDAAQQRDAILDFCRRHELPVDEVAMDGKPLAHVYIDDRAVNYWGNWWAGELDPWTLIGRFGGVVQGSDHNDNRRPGDHRPDGVQWIGLAGKMGAGKDTVARVLEGLYGAGQTTYTRGFAAGVKEMAAAAGIDPRVKTPAVRAVLQEIGQGERERDPNYWLDYYWHAVKQVPGFPHVNLLVPDVRYPNEVEFLQSKGFRVGLVRVDEHERMARLIARDGQVPTDRLNHESETALDHWSAWDFVIDND